MPQNRNTQKDNQTKQQRGKEEYEGNQHEETALLMKLWKRQIQKLT